jgi:hypothetical protein
VFLPQLFELDLLLRHFRHFDTLEERHLLTFGEGHPAKRGRGLQHDFREVVPHLQLRITPFISFPFLPSLPRWCLRLCAGASKMKISKFACYGVSVCCDVVRH